MDETLTPQAIWENLGPYLLPFGLRAIGALVLVIVGLRIAGWLSGLVRKQAARNPQIDVTLSNFFASLVQWSIITAGFALAIAALGGALGQGRDESRISGDNARENDRLRR